MQVWAEPGWYMLVTLLWAPALDTHGMVALVGATGELPLAEWLGIMDLVLVSRYGGAGGYHGYTNCLLIGAGIEFEIEPD